MHAAVRAIRSLDQANNFTVQDQMWSTMSTKSGVTGSSVDSPDQFLNCLCWLGPWKHPYISWGRYWSGNRSQHNSSQLRKIVHEVFCLIHLFFFPSCIFENILEGNCGNHLPQNTGRFFLIPLMEAWCQVKCFVKYYPNWCLSFQHSSGIEFIEPSPLQTF